MRTITLSEKSYSMIHYWLSCYECPTPDDCTAQKPCKTCTEIAKAQEELRAPKRSIKQHKTI